MGWRGGSSVRGRVLLLLDDTRGGSRGGGWADLHQAASPAGRMLSFWHLAIH